MAIQKIYNNQDFQKLTISNFKCHPLTTAEKTTLAGTLGAPDEGLLIMDTTLNILQVWSGSAFVNVSPSASLGQYQGLHTNATTAPSTTQPGDWYLWNGGDATLTFAGVTFTPNATVKNGDTLIFRTTNTWDIAGSDLPTASETVAGVLELATQAETNTGTNDVTTVTPLKLEQKLVNRLTPKFYFEDAVNLAAGVGTVITLPQVATNLKSFIANVKDSLGEQTSVQIIATSTTSITVTSDVTITGGSVSIVYI
jgi:hypothetical protein